MIKKQTSLYTATVRGDLSNIAAFTEIQTAEMSELAEAG